MEYRCANDLFNYCSGEPKWGKSPDTLGAGGHLGGGSCKLNPQTCGKHRTILQQLEGVTLPESSNYHHTQATRAKSRKKKRQGDDQWKHKSKNF